MTPTTYTQEELARMMMEIADTQPRDRRATNTIQAAPSHASSSEDGMIESVMRQQDTHFEEVMHCLLQSAYYETQAEQAKERAKELRERATHRLLLGESPSSASVPMDLFDAHMMDSAEARLRVISDTHQSRADSQRAFDRETKNIEEEIGLSLLNDREMVAYQKKVASATNAMRTLEDHNHKGILKPLATDRLRD